MDILTREELMTLAEIEEKWCVSIYLPTHRRGVETKQDPIAYKKLLQDAQEQLTQKGLRRPQIEQITAEARKLQQDSLFWQHNSDGLALFLTSAGMRIYRLPISPKEEVVVSNRVYIKPLLPILTENGQFYVLALSKNLVRVFRGSRNSISELSPTQIPKNLAEALQFDQPQSFLQMHSSSGRSGSAPVFHGHGGAEESAKTELQEYFRQISRALEDFLEDKDLPLVLAGVDYFHPLFREVSRYPYLMEEGIKGNPDLLRPEELQDKAWAIVEPIYLESRSKAQVQFEELSGKSSEKAADSLKDVLLAAYGGRVDALFVADGKQVWGTFDRDDGQILLDDDQGGEPLLDLASMYTFMKGGKVYLVDPEAVPGGKDVAAIYRF